MYSVQPQRIAVGRYICFKPDTVVFVFDNQFLILLIEGKGNPISAGMLYRVIDHFLDGAIHHNPLVFCNFH